MPVFKVNVKWGKEKFTDVEANTDEPPVVFKAQLFALSGVPPDRQKVMMKGAVLKDDEWGKMKLKEGVTVLMMGSADALPEAPKEKVVFMEDMTEGQLATALDIPPGLTNLGNTCYMNATLQCLRSVKELRDSLNNYSGMLMLGAAAMSPDQSITAGVRDLFDNMDRSAESFPPIAMLRVLHMCFPQFAEKSEHGGFQQQDANECWTEVVRCLQKRLPAIKSSDSTTEDAQADASAGAVAGRGFMDQYFGGEFAITMKCIEAEDEPVSNSTETFYQLSCFIEKEVKYMATGLKSRLEEHISKMSPSLSRDAQYLKTCKISRLPAYLTIQMVRFYYKEKESINAKILKGPINNIPALVQIMAWRRRGDKPLSEPVTDIKFTMILDVYDLCTEELQKKLLPAREKFKEEEDRRVEEKAQLGKDAQEAPKKKMKALPYHLEDDTGSNNSGYYELQAVLTHKGRSSSSGHYVGWVRREGDEWLMFDDDNVSSVTSEDILKLSGGGDWHCAYVLLYGPRILEIEDKGEGDALTVATPMES